MNARPSPPQPRARAKRALAACALSALFACGGAQTPAPAAPSQPALAAPAQPPPPPRLVLSVVIDQFGSAALHALEPLLASDGALAKARERGLIFDRVVYPYAVTLTAPGHATIYSGAVPAESGVSSNYLVDAATGKRRAFVDDGFHAVIGNPSAFAGPSALKVETLGDALKRQTQGRGKVVSLALKDRSAILPAGQHPDLVLWYDAKAKGWTTSSYYIESMELPGWLVQYASAHPIAAESVVWEPEQPERLAQLLGPDAAPGEGVLPGLSTTFPYVLANSPTPYELWPYFPPAADALLALALEAVAQLQLGADEVPDLLAVSISSTDYTGHTFGPDSWEYADHVRKVDRALGRLIDQLGARTDLAVLITSDHGGAPLPEHSRAQHPDALRIDPKALAAKLDGVIDSAFGAGDWVAGYVDTYLFLTPAARSHPEAARIRAALIAALRAEPGIAAAFDTHDLAPLQQSQGALEQAVLRSIHPEASGDIYVVTREYALPDIGIAKDGGTTHGSPYTYDTEVPVFVFAAGTKPARHTEAFDERRVASSLASLLGIVPPHPQAPPPLPGLPGQAP
jgi:predicted AlkP superfamily pyrophosphatase or phosphodiesterase